MKKNPPFSTLIVFFDFLSFLDKSVTFESRLAEFCRKDDFRKILLTAAKQLFSAAKTLKHKFLCSLMLSAEESKLATARDTKSGKKENFQMARLHTDKAAYF